MGLAGGILATSLTLCENPSARRRSLARTDRGV